MSDADFQRASMQATAAREQYRSAVNGMRGAYAGYQQAQAVATQASRALQDSTIRAPFAGEIAERKINIGEYVTPQRAVVTLVRTDPLRMEIQIPQERIADVHRDQTVEVRVDAWHDRIFPGTVRYISASVRADSRSLIVEALVPNADGALRPGLFATARIAARDTPRRGGRPRARGAERGGHQPRLRHRRTAACRSAWSPSPSAATPRCSSSAASPRESASPPKTSRGWATASRSSSSRERNAAMQWLAAICVRRPVFTWVLILALVVVGVASIRGLAVDRFPNIDFPIVLVTTVLPGASPEQVETEVSDKIEEAVNSISGLDELRSNSYEGLSVVLARFDLDKDTSVAAQEVRDRVNRTLSLLPQGIEQPRVERMDPDAAPVMLVALSGTRSVREITEYADKRVRRQIESLNGVGGVSVLGGRNRQVNVQLDPSRLQSFNLTAVDVQRALATQNVEIPGGEVDQGERSLNLRVAGRVSSISELNDIVVAQRGGLTVRVRDVGMAVDGEEESASHASVNGREVVILSVRKQSGTNTLAVIDALRSASTRSARRCRRASAWRSCATRASSSATPSTPSRSTSSSAASWRPSWCCSSSGTAAPPSSPRSRSRRRSSRPSRSSRRWGSRSTSSPCWPSRSPWAS